MIGEVLIYVLLVIISGVVIFMFSSSLVTAIGTNMKSDLNAEMMKILHHLNEHITHHSATK